MPASVAIGLMCSCGPNQSAAPKEKKPDNRWAGKWERKVWQNDADLEITNSMTDSFDFEIMAGSGGNTGENSGQAAIKGNTARFVTADDIDTCIIEFELMGDTMIAVSQVKGNCGTGLGVTFSGEYYKSGKHPKKTAADEQPEILAEPANTLLRKLTGAAYTLFVNSTQLTQEEEDLDGLHARVISSGVRGLFTEMENIIMIDSSKNIWAAVISDDTVLYFTNNSDYREKLPKTIDEWRSNFKDYPVIYKNK
jgi:hypothetical protein